MSNKNNTITRGTNRETNNENRLNGGGTLLPGNNEPQDPLVGLQNAITGSIGDLIKSVGGVNRAVDRVNKAVKGSTESISKLIDGVNGVNDKLIGVLGGMFGDTSAVVSNDAKHYLGKLGKINPANTVFGGLITNSAAITSLGESINKLVKNSVSLGESINKLVENSVSFGAFDDSVTKILDEVDTIHKAITSNIAPDNTSKDNISKDNTDNTQQTKQAAIGTTIDESVFENYFKSISNLENLLRESLDKAIKGIETKHVINDINITGIDADTAKHLTDLLLETKNLDVEKFITEISKIGELSSIKPIDGQFIESFTGTIDALANVNVDSAVNNVAGISLINEELSKIVPPTLNKGASKNAINAIKEYSNIINGYVSLLSNIDSEKFNPEKAIDIVAGISLINEELSKIVPPVPKGQQVNKNTKDALSEYSNIINGYVNLLSNIDNKKVDKLTNTSITDFVKDIPGIVGDVITAFEKIPDVTEDVLDKAGGVGNLINVVTAGVNIDDASLDNLGRYLRRIIAFTDKPTIASKLGLSDRGLIWKIIQNVSKAAQEAGATEKSVKGISVLLGDIVKIGLKLDTSSLLTLEKNISILATITGEKHLHKVLSNVNALDNVMPKEDTISNIKKILGSINELEESLDLGNLSKLLVKTWTAQAAMYSLNALFFTVNQINERIGEVDVNNINTAINKVGDIDANGLDKIQGIVTKIAAIFSIIAKAAPAIIIGGLLLKTGLVSDAIDNLSTILGSIGEVDVSDETVDKLNKLSGIGKILAELCLGLSVAGATALLAFAGAVALNVEVGIINKVIGNINNSPIDDNTVKKLKSIAIVVASCSAMMVAASAVAALTVASLPQLIGFTVALSLFIFGVIGAVNIATRNIEDAEYNAYEIGKLVAISATIMFLGGTLMSMFPQIGIGALEFTATLSLFILTVIGAYNLATRKMQPINEAARDIMTIVVVSAGTLLAGATLMMIPGMSGAISSFATTLGIFVIAMVATYTVASRFSKVLEGADEFADLVGISATTMLIGGGLFLINKNLIWSTALFATELALFVGTVSKAYAKNMEAIGDSLENAKDFAVLVGLSAALLLTGGSLFIKYPKLIMTTALFAAELGAFVYIVSAAYKKATDNIDENLNTAKSFAILVGLSASILMTGGILMAQNNDTIWTNIVFATELFVFVALIGHAYETAAGVIKKNIKVAKDFTILVGLSAAVLITGGALMAENKDIIWTNVVFATELFAFIAVIGYAYEFAAKRINENIDVAKEFAILVGISAATMLIGGYLMSENPDLWIGTAIFAGTLSVFIAVVTLSYSVFAKHAKKMMGAAIALTALIAVSAVCLLTAGMMILDNPGLDDAIVTFAITTGGLVFAFTIMVGLLGNMKAKDLVFGVVAVAIITAIIDNFVDTFAKINEIANIMDEDKMDAAMTSMLYIIGGACVLVGVFAGLITLGALFGGGIGAVVVAAVIGSAEVAAYGLVRIIDAMAIAMLHMADASNALASMKVPDVDKVFSFIGKFIAIGAALIPLAQPWYIPIMTVARINICGIASVLNTIGAAIQSFASLTVPEIDANGKISGERKLQESDFTDAANNIEKIITTIGGALINTYNKNESMFSAGSTIKDLLGMDTPFSRVCKSCANMGNMISDIAEGVRDYAQFRINTYDKNGKKNGSRPFTSKDFTDAANNIETIITTLGNAVITTYKGNEHLFTDTKQWWQAGVRTPFAMVVKAVSGLGNMISDIAEGVRDYAQLRIAIYDKNGKKVGSREMTPADFLLAGINVSTILTILGNAVINTYKGNKHLFTDSSTWHTDADKTPFAMVVKSMAGTGKLISEGAKAVEDVLNMKADWAQTDVDDKVSKIIGTLVNAIEKEANKPAFQDNSLFGLFSNNADRSPFSMVKFALQGTSKLIDEGIAVIDKVNKINIPDAKALQAKTDTILGVLVNSIASKSKDPAFQDKSFFSIISGGDPEDTPFGIVKAATAGSSKLIDEAIGVIDRVLKLKVNTKTIGGIVKSIVSAIPNSILGSTLYYKSGNTLTEDDKAIREWWQDPDFSDINSTYKEMNSLINTVLSTYNAIAKLTTGENGVNVDTIKNDIKTMLNGIPNVFANLNLTQDVKVIEEYTKKFGKYAEAIENVTDIYSTVWDLLDDLNSTENTNGIVLAGDSLIFMFTYLKRTMDMLNGDAESNGTQGASAKMNLMTLQMVGFAESMSKYRDAVTDLAAAFDMAPTDFTKYDNVQKALNRINVEITNVPELENFREETEILNTYVRTVNSIDTSKVDRLTNLANSITNMSSKLGSLEGLTDVLANKVSVVLANLTDKMEESAQTIRIADSMQTDRHKKINEALDELKKLISKPLNINVTHKAQQDNTLSIGAPGSGTDLGSSQQNNGGQPQLSTPSTSTSTAAAQPASSQNNSKATNQQTTVRNAKKPQSVNNNTVPAYLERKTADAGNVNGGFSGISFRQAKELAHNEAIAAIHDWQAKNAKRGNGGRVGAKRNS